MFRILRERGRKKQMVGRGVLKILAIRPVYSSIYLKYGEEKPKQLQYNHVYYIITITRFF
jgi:hypothetical protein